jgi:hypothetical protein
MFPNLNHRSHQNSQTKILETGPFDYFKIEAAVGSNNQK